jgi:hypothetical protein
VRNARLKIRMSRTWIRSMAAAVDPPPSCATQAGQEPAAAEGSASSEPSTAHLCMGIWCYTSKPME